MLALIKIPANAAYIVLFALVGLESSGLPLPGETALISVSLLASQGQADIVIVIVVATVAAVLGDNVGYLIGRTGGRRLLERPGFLEHHRRMIIVKGEPFFEKHGPKAVFLGRWVAGLRIAAAWLAGINHMRWRTFLFWNALGGAFWATATALLAYYLGSQAEEIFKLVGLAGVAAAVLAVSGLVLWRRQRTRRADASAWAPSASATGLGRHVEDDVEHGQQREDDRHSSADLPRK
jgi:undecaprenyl-diphosphatase